MPTYRKDLHLGHEVPLVETDDIMNGAVTTEKLDDGAVTTDKLSGVDDPGGAAVTTSKIVDNAVTESKIAKDAVTNSKIADDAVTTDKLSGVDDPGGAAVTTSKIVDNAVTESKIAKDAVTSDKIQKDAINSDHIKESAVESRNIGDGQVLSRHIQDDAVTSDKLSDVDSEAGAAVTAGKIAAGAVHTEHIAANAVVAGNIASGAVQEGNIATGAVTAGKIAANAVVEGNIAEGAVTTAKIANNAVTTAKIAYEAVTEEKLAPGAITTEKLATPVIEQLQTIMDEVPTVGSVKPINSAGVLAHGSAFDVSEYNKSEGVLATYETLAAALAAVPATSRRGGMSIKFIQLTPATYSVVKTEGLTEQPTGTLLQSASAVVSGTYTAAQLSDFATLPANVGNVVTYYVAVSGDAVTYTSWVITKATNDSTEYVQYFLTKNEWSVSAADWQKMNLWKDVSQLSQEMAGLIDVEDLVLRDNYYFTHYAQTANDNWYEGLLIPYNRTKTYTLVCPEDLTSNSPQKVVGFASNKITRTDYKGYSNGRVLTTFVSGTAYIALSVRKTDAQKFALYENGVEVFRGNKAIQNNIPGLLDRVETINGNLTGFVEKFDSERENYKLAGAGSTFVSTQIQLIKGRKYQIVFDNPSWARNDTGTDDDQYILRIGLRADDVFTNIFSVYRRNDTGTFEKSYEFDTLANSEFFEIGGRANIGTDIVFSLEDITEITNVRTELSVPINNLTFEITRANGYVTYSNRTHYNNDENWYVGGLIPVVVGDRILINVASDIDTSSKQKLGIYDSNGNLFSYFSIYNNRIITVSNDLSAYVALSTRITDAHLFKLTVNGTICYQGTSDVNLSVPKLYKQVEQIEEKIEADDIYNRNADKLPLLFASSNKNLRLQFLIATDSHEGWRALQNAVDFVNKCEHIQALFVFGDCTGQAAPSLSTFERYNQIINTCTKPVFCIAGNHDCGYDKRLRHTALEDKICEYIVEPTYQHLAVGEYTQGKAYYYHDFTDKKVRAIFLYEFDEPISIVENAYWEEVAFDSTKTQYAINVQYAVNDIVNFGLYTANSFRCIQAHTSSADNEIKLNEYRGYRFIGQTQMAWLVSTMLSTPVNYNIIICTHVPASSDYSNTLFRTSKFCTQFLNGGDGFNGMADDYLGILAEAYNNGTSGTIKVSGKGTFAYLNVLEDAEIHYAYEISYDFSRKNNGAKFVCFFSGHTHVDCVFKNARNQFCITPTFTTATTRQFNTNDVPRNSDPKELAYDALTAVALDTINNCVVLTRVGTTGTTDGYLRDVDRIDII